MSNVITSDDIIKAVGGYGDETATFFIGSGDDAVSITVVRYLSLEDRKRLVDGIADMCFVDAEGESIYCPYLREFAFAYHIVLFFTNIDIRGDVNDVSRFLNATRIADSVIGALDQGYFDELCREVSEMIEYRKARLLKKSRLDDVLANASATLKTLNEKLESLDDQDILQFLGENIPNLKEEIAKADKEAEEKINS